MELKLGLLSRNYEPIKIIIIFLSTLSYIFPMKLTSLSVFNLVRPKGFPCSPKVVYEKNDIEN